MPEAIDDVEIWIESVLAEVTRPTTTATATTATLPEPDPLLAQPGGRYDLYRREQGLAGFGRLLAQSLDIDQAGEHLAAGSPE